MLHIAALLFFICIRVAFKLIKYVKCAGPHAYTIFLFCLLDSVAGNHVRAYTKYFHGQFEKSL